MSDLARRIREMEVPAGSLALFWLAQAGWAFKTAKGKLICVDPYLSNAAERLHGFRRLMPSPIDPADVNADLVITTHDHIDHLDDDSIEIMARNPRTRFAGSLECVKKYPRLGISEDRFQLLEVGTDLKFDGFSVRAVFADHGESARDAVGLLLDFDGIRVYDTADTAYRPEQMRWANEAGIDVLLAAINGAYGNMNAREAAQLARDIRPRVTLPQHFWMFAEHHMDPGGEPGNFVAACRELAPGVKTVLLTAGGSFLIDKAI